MHCYILKSSPRFACLPFQYRRFHVRSIYQEGIGDTITNIDTNIESYPPWLDEFRKKVAPLNVDISRNSTRRLSRCSNWYNPILKENYDKHFADAVVFPKSVDDVVRINKGATELNIPVTPRGCGTGSKGLVVPFEGGIIMDMRQMNKEIFVNNDIGTLRCEAGRTIDILHDSLRLRGWELRIFPTSKRESVGGFIAGERGGIGSITFGMLGDPGNIVGLQIVTMEKEPRILEIRDNTTIAGIVYSGGTCGVITQVELALSPSQNWSDLVIAFGSLESTANFCVSMGMAPSIVKRELMYLQWPLGMHLGTTLPEDHHVVAMVASRNSIEPLESLVKSHNGKLIHCESSTEDNKPLYEFCWNNLTRISLLGHRPETWTFLEIHFSIGNGKDLAEFIRQSTSAFPGDLLMHIEFVKTTTGGLLGVALPVVRYDKASHLHNIVDYFKKIENSKFINLLTPIEVSDKTQRSLKIEHNPYGLLNPGKFKIPDPEETIQ